MVQGPACRRSSIVSPTAMRGGTPDEDQVLLGRQLAIAPGAGHIRVDHFLLRRPLSAQRAWSPQPLVTGVLTPHQPRVNHGRRSAPRRRYCVSTVPEYTLTLLSSLLPGVRALRAPLAAGFVWLLALWLALEPVIPTSTPTTGIGASIARIEGLAEAIGWLAMVTFVAYLVGSVSSDLAVRYRKWLFSRSHETVYENDWYVARSKFPPMITRLLGFREGPSRDALQRLRGYLFWELSQSGKEVNQTMMEIREEWDELPLTIVGDRPTLYTEIDRYRAEAEFREALEAPLAALALVVAMRGGTWWAAVLALVGGLAAIYALMVTASDAHGNADTIIANAVATKLITPRALQPDDARAAATAVEPDDAGAAVTSVPEMTG